MTLATEIQGTFADAKKPVVRRKPQPSFLTGPLPITFATGVALLVSDLDRPEDACVPFFGQEGWPVLAAAE